MKQTPPTSQNFVARGERGTTLIELMMGLTVLMVVMMVALPLTSSFLRQQNLRNGAEELLYAAELARSRARSNRKAYGLFIGKGGLTQDELSGEVMRGDGPSCSTVVVGTSPIVHTFDFSKDNKAGEPEVMIAQKAPRDFAQGSTFVCFKPDGRVLNGATSMPFSPPAGTTYSAGDAFFELVRVSTEGTQIGNRLQVQITYSGNARITFGYDLDALK
jgi:Tfp pilus assembly protein FimT